MKDLEKEGQWLEFPLPSAREMPAWITQEAKNQGGVIEGAAAVELARRIGENTMQARQEIAKILSYTGEGNPVSREDVRLMCPPSAEEKIFSLVGAVGKRDSRGALVLLQRLQTEMPIQYIFSMVARQIRQYRRKMSNGIFCFRGNGLRIALLVREDLAKEGRRIPGSLKRLQIRLCVSEKFLVRPAGGGKRQRS